ncbi:MAG: acyl-CoA dehydrogenase family protein, partial [Proteobacteria bacterium]|nr:acyl-CoA dehydrogenase family protein [Pseudomonadota bacterium]
MDFTLTKEQQDIIRAAKKFALGEFPDRCQEFDREETFDFDIWRNACELGFVGINLSEESGGAGMGIFELCLIVEEFWVVDAGIALAVISTTFGAELVDTYGTEEQKKKYITPLITGKAIMGCAITEPDAGSDTAAATTTAIK